MKLAEDVSEFGTIEQHPSQEGRNMTMLLAPVRAPGHRGRPDEKKPSVDGKAQAESAAGEQTQAADAEQASAAEQPTTTASD
jgi:translation initiation factor IF-3